MFKWIKKLMCKRSVNLTCERSVKYYYAIESTNDRPDERKYYRQDMKGYKWAYTWVVYALCTKSHEKTEVQEFFGTSISQWCAEQLVEKLNNL